MLPPNARLASDPVATITIGHEKRPALLPVARSKKRTARHGPKFNPALPTEGRDAWFEREGR